MKPKIFHQRPQPAPHKSQAVHPPRHLTPPIPLIPRQVSYLEDLLGDG